MKGLKILILKDQLSTQRIINKVSLKDYQTGKFKKINESKALEELSKLAEPINVDSSPKRTEISYRKYMESIDFILKKIFMIVAGLLAGISLVYLVFVLANMNNIENMHNIVLRLDQLNTILSLLSFILCLNLTLSHKENHIEILKTLDTQRIANSKRKHVKNIILSILYGLILMFVLIGHHFMVAISSSTSLSSFKSENIIEFLGFIILKTLIFIVVISAWVFVVCNKRRSQTFDST